ncbi:hypothetical protein CsSME_00039838 [Camellia sinensis var. sinensis]
MEGQEIEREKREDEEHVIDLLKLVSNDSKIARIIFRYPLLYFTNKFRVSGYS